MTKKVTLDIELMKKQCLELNTTLTAMYKSLQAVETQDYITIKGQHKIYDTQISGYSVLAELLALADKAYKNNGNYRIVSIYKSFIEHMKKAHSVDVTNDITPQMVGRLFNNLDTTNTPFYIIKGKNRTSRYYDILKK